MLALRLLLRRQLLWPVVVLGIVLTATNVVVATSSREAGGPLPTLFVVAAFLRLAALMLVTVAVLRMVTGSPRRAWVPDGAFWLYGLTLPVGVALSMSLRQFIDPGAETPLLLLAISAAVSLIEAPLTVWLVALAVEKPLAWRPRPWLARWSWWLPPLLLWTLLFRPIVAAHTMLSSRLLSGAGEWFWPLALFDGALSLLVLLMAVGLNSAAYHRFTHAEARPGRQVQRW
jgi:hypothetical protein